MTVVTWAWRGQIMRDFFVFPWLQLSTHFKGESIWAWEFHWKGSNGWYQNFRRCVGKDKDDCWNRTRLTLRLGKYIIVVGGVDIKTYYKNVILLKMVCRGKVVFQVPVNVDHEYGYVEADTLNATKEEVLEAVELMKKNYWFLSKDYPGDTWRN